MSFFVGCLPTAMPDFKPLKEWETLVNFSVGVFWFLSGSKMDLSGSKWTFPAPKSIEFGAGSVHFEFGLLIAFLLHLFFRTWREVPPPPPLTHEHLLPTAPSRMAVFVRHKLWQLASGS